MISEITSHHITKIEIQHKHYDRGSDNAFCVVELVLTDKYQGRTVVSCFTRPGSVIPPPFRAPPEAFDVD
jgi:hypothetical protein